MRASGNAGLDTLRDRRRSIAWLFCGLLLLVCGERRLADHRYNLYKLSRAGAGIENAETLDGDEVALRLLAIDDASPSVLTMAAAAPQPFTGAEATPPRSRRVELPPLRAPPPAPAASA